MKRHLQRSNEHWLTCPSVRQLARPGTSGITHRKHRYRRFGLQHLGVLQRSSVVTGSQGSKPAKCSYVRLCRRDGQWSAGVEAQKLFHPVFLAGKVSKMELDRQRLD